MGKSYSMEMREKVARDVARGQTVRTVAARFEVSVASAVRWSGLSGTQRSVASSRRCRRPGGGILAPFMAFLTSTVDAKSDVIMPEVVDLLVVHGGPRVGPASLSRVLCKVGYTYKNTADGELMRTR